MDGYSRHDIRRWVDDVLLHARSDVLGDKDEVFKLGEGVALEAGDNDNLSTRSEVEIGIIDGPVDTQSTEWVSVAGSTPTEPETTTEPPAFTQPLPPPANFTISTITASAQPQPIITLTPITHSARPPPTTTKDTNDRPEETKDHDRDHGKHEKTDSASVTDGFVTVTTSRSSSIAITTPIAVSASVTTTSVLTSATASPAISNGAALEEAQQMETSSGHMSGGAKAGIAIGVVAGVVMLGIVLFWLFKCFRSRKSEADSESSIRAFLSGRKSGPNDGGLPPPATAAGAGVGADQLSANSDPRSNSQILDELIAASYAHQNGQEQSIPNGYVLSSTVLDEKQADGAYPVTIIQPAPTHQPEVRKSVASWLRKHHPLKLNPLSIRGSTFSAFSSRSRASSAYGSSQQGGGGGGGGGRDSMASSDYPSPTSYDPDAPPLPEIPATYFNEISKPLSPMPKKLPTAAQNMKAMKFQSVWSDSSAGTDMMDQQDRSRMTVSSEGNESLFNLYEGGDGQVRSPSQVVTSLSPPPLLAVKDQGQGQGQDQGEVKGQGQSQRTSLPPLRP